MPSPAQQHEQTVRDFCAAWDRVDADGAIALMHEDAIYHNMPMEPLQGHAAIRAFIEPFFAVTTAAEFRILTLVADDQRVVTERLDFFTFKEGGGVDGLPVLGIFEFAGDGRISAWREYWDLPTWVARGGPPLG